MQMKPEDTARLAALKKEMSAAEAELAKLKKDAAGLVGQAEKLQGQIDNAGGVKMKQQKQEVSALQQVTNIRMWESTHSVICHMNSANPQNEQCAYCLKTTHNRATISSKLEEDNEYLHVHMVSAQVEHLSLP